MTPHFGKDNIYIQDYIFNPVHTLNTMSEWEQGWENDYYLDTGKRFFLVNIKLSENNQIQLKKNENYKHCDYIFIGLNDMILEKGQYFLLEYISKEIKMILGDSDETICD